MRRVRVAVLSVGTEVTSGEIVDTNAAELARMASAYGADVLWHAAVPDDRARMTAVLRLCLREADLTVASGGLGPTADDVTRQALADAVGRPLRADPRVEAWLKERSARAGRPMPLENLRQAQYPEGGELLPNPGGTAPGVLYRDPESGHRVILLPGPPREMLPMAESYVRPLLEQTLWTEVVGHPVYTARRVIRVVGVGESQIDEWLAELMTDENPSLRPYAKEGEVHLRLVARADRQEEAEAQVERVLSRVRAILGPAVYGVGDEANLARVALTALKARKETVAVAESLTAGWVAAELASVPGASHALVGGIVAYHDAVKVEALGVQAAQIAQDGVVSQTVARAMAQGVRQRLGSTWGLALTGWAGPEAAPGQTVGEVWFGLAGPTGVWAVRRLFDLPRNAVRQHAVQVALDLLRRGVLGLPIPVGSDPQEAIRAEQPVTGKGGDPAPNEV